MIYKSLLAAAACGSMLAVSAPEAVAGPDDYLGEIMTVGFTFCPRGTMEANGQLLAISQHQALFSLFGTTYGGDGRTSFALPDLRGRTAIGTGTGPGLTQRDQGRQGGVENDSTKLPVRIHTQGGGVKGEATTGDNMQPFLVLKHCVATTGIYPARN